MREPDSKQQIHNIVESILSEEQRLRAKYSILQFQNTLGLSFLMLAFFGMLTSAFLYYNNIFSAWQSVLLSAFFASIAHEIEHDLIHRLYFRKHWLLHNLMMLLVWLMRPNTVNPWYRRKIHLLHHKVSGTEQDIEERLVGNGIANQWLRFVVMFDGLIGLILQRKIFKKEIKSFSFMEVFNAGVPLATLYFACWYIFLFSHFSLLVFDESIYPKEISSMQQGIDFIVVVLILPNFIRSACLNIVTSYLHYYRGVENMLQQTQVLKVWFLWPFNLFCFNFSQTHAIHHIVVKQPFYLRQMLSKNSHKVMRKNGVRFNDFHSFSHANRYVK